MSAVHFSGSASAIDRRRRRLVTEIDHEFDLSGTTGATTLHNCGGEIAPFPMLSRDRLIRRVISPRLWKHVTVAIVLILIPMIYGFVTLRSLDDTPIADQVLWASRLNASRGLSGLALFAAAQFCLVIAWVRSASAVDFRGAYRWWRWMAVGLFTASMMKLTGTTLWMADLIALGLEPIFGRIDAARTALMLVPTGGCLAVVLHRLIPDMGRCRSAQAMLVIAVFLLAVRACAGVRLSSTSAVFHLSTLELLISALVLSAFQLHARFVIHVNPNPPLTMPRDSSAAMASAVGNHAAESAVTLPVSRPSEGVLVTPSIAAPTLGETAPHVPERPSMEHEALTTSATALATPDTKPGQGNSKHGTKQKHRKAG
ncbi:MAG: hypothetical protein NTX48_06295 [Planctomycetales bacterium]|nr:hypothetical protein [Planctomycetales bacterium]